MFVFNEARTDEFIHNSLDFYRQAYISDDKYNRNVTTLLYNIL